MKILKKTGGSVNEKLVREALRQIQIGQGAQNILDAGIIGAIQVQGGHVIVTIEVDPAQGGEMEPLRQSVEKAVLSCKGVEKVSAILTAQKPNEAQAAQQKRAIPDPHGMEKNPVLDIPARHIIVVASGKGGVGKSSVAANLAVGLAQVHKFSTGSGAGQVLPQPLRVGLLDADIYGPSQPLMMGDVAYKPALDEAKKLIPLSRHGIKIMSIGFLTDADKALVWRGPMVQTAFYQMLRDVAWAEKGAPLDYLVIDMPPGTGDVQLTLAQKVKASGAVIVSTPQDIALIDARRAVEMFNKTNVPILGIVENMSIHICENCGHEDHIFGHGGAAAEAKKIGVPFLGALPLSRQVREDSDAGQPIILARPQSAEAQHFMAIVRAVRNALN